MEGGQFNTKKTFTEIKQEIAENKEKKRIQKEKEKLEKQYQDFLEERDYIFNKIWSCYREINAYQTNGILCNGCIYNTDVYDVWYEYMRGLPTEEVYEKLFATIKKLEEIKVGKPELKRPACLIKLF